MASAAASEPEGAGEDQPLLGDGDGPMATIKHRESIYSFVTFMPPLTRRTHGHYCTLPVLLALILFLFTIMCQLGLTVIAGGYIQDKSRDFKVSLIRHEQFTTTAMTPIDYVRETVEHAFDKVTEVYEEPVTGCCSSAECDGALPCCGAKPKPNKKHYNQRAQSYQPTRNSSSFLALRRNESTAPLKKMKDLLDSFVYGSSGDVVLCRKGANGFLDCTPPSYAFLDAWHELDDNQDGVWSLEEAEADRTNLGCQLGLSPVDFFNSAVRGIIKDARDTADNSYAIPLVPESIETRRAIPKDYFEQFKGLVVLCTAVDVGRCGQMISQGFFDGAIGLKSQVTRGGIHDLDSSLDFCQRMLRPNGVCEQALPHTFQLYRARIAQKCGRPSYSADKRYTSPHDPRDVTSIISVSYGQLAQFESANEFQFQTFLYLILLVWCVTLVDELLRILQLLDMLANFSICNDESYSFFPKRMRDQLRNYSSFSSSDLLKTPRLPANLEKLSGLDADPSESLVVVDISRPHHVMCCTMCAIRLCLWAYMGNVGTTFLVATFSYEDLLFNAVALAFIFELPEFLYVFLIADEIKEQLADAETVEYPTSLPVSGWKKGFVSKAFWGLFVTPLAVFLVVCFNHQQNIMSSLEALRCACFQSGSNCVAARRFTGAWWNDYWKDTFPLAKLRSSYLA